MKSVVPIKEKTIYKMIYVKIKRIKSALKVHKYNKPKSQIRCKNGSKQLELGWSSLFTYYYFTKPVFCTYVWKTKSPLHQLTIHSTAPHFVVCGRSKSHIRLPVLLHIYLAESWSRLWDVPGICRQKFGGWLPLEWLLLAVQRHLSAANQLV